MPKISDRTAKITLIERPRSLSWTVGGKTGLKQLSGLSSDDFNRLTDISRRIAREGLDMTVNFSDQDPKRLNQVLHDIAEECPFMKRYKDYWPITFYLKMWVKGTHSNAKRLSHRSDSDDIKTHERRTSSIVPRGLSTPPRRQFVGRVPPRSRLHSRPYEDTPIAANTRSHRAAPPPPPPPHPTTVGATNMRHEDQMIRRNQAPAPSLNGNLSRTSRSGMTSASSQAPSGSYSLSALSHTAPSMMFIDEATKPVLHFLQNLRAPLPELLPLCLSEGVTNMKRLRASAIVPDGREWLEKCVAYGRMKNVEAAIIRDGLAKLAAEVQL